MNKREQDEFESLLEIDVTRLDEECINQPRKVWTYGKMYAKAVKELDEALAEQKVIEADVDAEIREKPGAFGLDKLTEAAVKRAILRHKKYQEVQEKVCKAKYFVNMVDAANKALDHRRTCLSMLNNQDERNYFSRPVETSPNRKPLRKRKDAL